MERVSHALGQLSGGVDDLSNSVVMIDSWEAVSSGLPTPLNQKDTCSATLIDSSLRLSFTNPHLCGCCAKVLVLSKRSVYII